MTDNEIIKALECFALDKDFDDSQCIGCAFEHQFCTANMSVDIAKPALDLINRQKAEIERLKERDETAEKIIREQGGTILHLKNENSRLFDRNFELSEKGEKAVIACIFARAEAFKEFAEKANKMITDIYNKHIFGCNDLNDEEKDAIINFSDDITGGFDNLLKEMTEPSLLDKKFGGDAV